MNRSRGKQATAEQRNPRSRGLDRKPTIEILRILNREDARVPRAVGRALPQVARAVDAIVESLQNGGKVFYIGAGTSGRLGALDASELPPTFGVPSHRVQAIIAGGRRALMHAVEAAEDSAKNGARDLAARKLKLKDVVVGLAASGTTPYVLGALEHAKRHGARTIGVTVNARSPLARIADIAIVARVGPEVLAGSTRMKAGTAQKLVLNMLSTTAMVRLGRVYDNWMIDLALTNQKLRRRGLRILAEATGASASRAKHALRQSGHDLRVALIMLETGLPAAAARQRLRENGDNLRRALQAFPPSAGSPRIRKG